MRTRFTEEVDTYEKFQEVCRNCSKNYLGYFILLAWGDNTPSDYLEIACDIFFERFVTQSSRMVVQSIGK